MVSHNVRLILDRPWQPVCRQRLLQSAVAKRLPRRILAGGHRRERSRRGSEAEMAKSKRLKLEIDMIPLASFGQSVRNLIPRSRWNRIKEEVHDKNGRACEICGSPKDLCCH